MNDNLKEIVSKIKKKREIANSDAGNDPRNRNTKLGFIKRAREDLKELFLEYRKEVKDRSIFMLCSGDKSEAFAKLAKKDFECFMVSAEEFYETITANIDKRLYENTNASRTLFDFINTGFENIAMDIDIIGYQPVIFESKYKKVLKDKNDMIQMTIKAFNDKTGSEAVGLYVAHKVAEEGVNKNTDSKFFPIVVYSENESLISELSNTFTKYFDKVFRLAAGKTTKDFKNKSFDSVQKISKESVEKILLQVRNKIK